MNKTHKILLAALLLSGLQYWLVGCVVAGGGGYYGGPWYHDGPWMDGGGWGRGPRVGVGIDIHPPGFRR